MLATLHYCRRPRWSGTLAATLLVALLFASHAFSQDRGQRLILKDGSYQIVTKYEIKGDRVRYLSGERHEWEELPASLVDWPATEQYEKDRAAGASSPEAKELDKELSDERALDEARLPQVAPGLRLPEDTGVFLLDSYNGEPQLVEVQQSAGDLNRNVKGNILRGAINPVAGNKQTIELAGEHAAVQSHGGVPSLYINVDESSDQPDQKNSPQSPQQPQQAIVPFDKFRIVRAQVKGGKRIVGNVKRNITGKVSQEERFVKTTVTGVSGGWLKVTPVESLAPGEFALVEMLGKEGMNLYVWDFGVNPKAPANPNAWKPETRTGNSPAKKNEGDQK